MKVGQGFGDNPFRKHGRSAGWADFRYGAKEKRPVYDPSKAKHRTPIIVDKAHKKAVIRDIAATLRGWEHSAFEHEAACRHGLRQGFCENGAPWGQADDEAAHIVREALHSNGAKRPTWDQGQWQYTTGRENCVWCLREIDDPSATRGQRYCSAECAQSAVINRGGRDAVRHDQTVRAAYRQVAKSKAKPRPCKQCGESFKSERKEAQFCSVRCMRHATGPMLAVRCCEECSVEFKPHRNDQRYCSYSCSTTSNMRAARAKASPRTCSACEMEFQPATGDQQYCSTNCRKRVENLAQRLRKGVNVRLSRMAFDQYFTRPINSAQPRWLTPERFDELVAA